MTPTDDPDYPFGGDAENRLEAATILCPHCAATNPDVSDFCARCSAPLSVIAMTDPLRETLSAGFLYREATQGSPRRIVVVGIWLIFLPGLASLPLAWAGGATDQRNLLTQGAWSLASAVIPVLTTLNYLRRRRPADLPDGGASA